jgi:tetratricopeptide (TPR) repeat protein
MFLVWLIALALTASQLRAQEPTPQSPPPTASPQPSPFHPHKLAQGYLYSGQIAEAIKTWEQALAKDANDWEILTALGAALYADGQISRAVPYLQRALALTEGDWTLRLFLATALHEAGQEAQAAREFKAIIDGAPNQGTVQIASDKLRGRYFRDQEEAERQVERQTGARLHELKSGPLWLGQLYRITWARPDLKLHDNGTVAPILMVATFLHGASPGAKRPGFVTGGDYVKFYGQVLFRAFSYASNRLLVTVTQWQGTHEEKDLGSLTRPL